MHDIPGIDYNKLYFVEDCVHHTFGEGIHLNRTLGGSMEDVFQPIDHVTRSEEWNWAFFKPNFKTVQPVMQVNEVNYSKATRHNMVDQSNNG